MIESHDLFGLVLNHSDTQSAHDITHNSGDSLLQALHQSQNSLGQEYLINDSGQLAPVVGYSSSSSHTTSTMMQVDGAPTPTVVGPNGGFQIKLIWDSSVTSAPKGFMQAVIDAAQYYASQFSNKETVNINVGYGEIAGGQPVSGLSESESNVYLTDYATVTNALAAKDGFTFAASNEPKNSYFLITSAELKTLGLIDPSSTALDGYIGFNTLSDYIGYSWNLAHTPTGQNTGTGPLQLDLQSAALHEISEVLGRIGIEGTISLNNIPIYTPLDLFNFTGTGNLSLSPSGGYFSTDNGVHNLGLFNSNPYGDIADWASYNSPTESGTQGLPAGAMDAFAAFAHPGYNGDISTSDLQEMAALGYTLKHVA